MLAVRHDYDIYIYIYIYIYIDFQLIRRSIRGVIAKSARLQLRSKRVKFQTNIIGKEINPSTYWLNSITAVLIQRNNNPQKVNISLN